MKHDDFEGLMYAAIMASYKKITAGLKYAGSGQHDGSTPGVVDAQVAIDALGMFYTDMMHCMKEASESCNQKGR